MSIQIEHVGETPARKYGIEFQPGQKEEIETDVVIAYSLMEIARDLRYIRNAADNADRERESRERRMLAGLSPNEMLINNTVKVETHGIISRWLERRKWRKTHKNLAKKWKVNPPLIKQNI